MRIGIDLGGTKIEGRRARPRRPPRGRAAARRRPPAITTATVARRARPGPGHRARGRARRPRSASACRARCRRRPGWSRTPIPPASTAGRSTATSWPRSAARSVSPTTPIASPCPRRSTARPPGRKVVFGVILGTGVGGGIAVEGRLVDRRQRASPASGATTPCPGPPTTSVPARCAIAAGAAASRSFLSGPSLARDAGAPDAETVEARAAAGDGAAEAALARYEDRLARALAGVINLLDPDAIVLGGGLGRIDAALRQRAAPVGPARFFRHGRRPALCRPPGAIRAASAAPPGCGRTAERFFLAYVRMFCYNMRT